MNKRPQPQRAGSAQLRGVCIDADFLLGNADFDYDTRLPLTVFGIDADNCAAVGEQLARLVGADAPISCEHGNATVKDLTENAIHSGKIVVSPLNFLQKSRFGTGDLLAIMRRLRAADGCPWDRAQTHESLRANAVEEAYELVEAINNGDVPNIREECGDVLLQALFHCMIGEDTGEFDYRDCVTELCAKLIFRHTHIFGDVKAADADEALKAWDNAKTREKKYTGLAHKMDCVARALPAAERSLKIQNAAKKAGMDFASFEDTIAKIAEEIAEFRDAPAEKAEEEAGDLLFSVVNALRWKKIHPEIALGIANDKFVKRFRYVEERLGDTQADPEKLDALWEEAKRETR